MTSVYLLFVVTAACVAALTGVQWTRGRRARARHRLRSGATQIRDHDVVTLVGTVRPLATQLTAPISNRACVCFEVVARVFNVGLGTHRELAATIEERKLAPFELVTTDGVVQVDGESADVVLPVVPLIPRRLEREIAFLEEHGLAADDAPTASFDEIVVAAGDRIAVHGVAIVEHAHAADERGYRDAPTRIRIVAHGEHPLTIGKPT
jgi:hypothetical protein